MNSIVIADDEINLCLSLKKVIENHCENISVVGTFFNGRELLDYIRNNHVDIVITDIKMPLATGLDVAKFISENKLNTHIIITTGYKEFEYARQAINYHVDCLLAKPFAYKEIIEKIKELQKIIESEHSSALTEDELYLSNFLIFKGKLEEIYLGVSGSQNDLQIQNLKTVADIKIYKCFEIIFSPENENEKISRQTVSDFCELFEADRIVCTVGSTQNTVTCLALYSDCLNISELISELENAVKLHCGYKLIYSLLSFPNVEEWAKYCLCRNLTEQYFSDVEKDDRDYGLKRIEINLKSFSEAELYSLYQYLISFAGIELSDTEINQAGITPDSITALLSKIHELTKSSISKSDSLIASATEYLQNNYQNPDISLTEIAKAIDVNPNYLSQIIKKKTGDRFVDLLLKIRMKNAKQLLNDPSIPVKEVAYLVGYRQVPYFRQLFKNYYGITPTEYRLRRKMN